MAFSLRRRENDAVLVAAERKCQELLARADAQLKINAAQRFGEPTLNEIAKRVGTIYNTPPSTLIGAAVKLRMAIHPELGTEEDESSEIVIALRQVLALIEREIGQDDNVVVRISETQRRAQATRAGQARLAHSKSTHSKSTGGVNM